MNAFFKELLHAWSTGGWVMIALAVLGVIIYGTAAYLVVNLYHRGITQISDADMRRWVGDPANAPREFRELSRYTQDEVRSLEDIEGRFREIESSKVSEVDRRITFLNVMVVGAPLFGLLGTKKLATTAIVGTADGSLNSNNSVGFSAGGTISSVDDIAIYFHALMNGELLNEEQFEMLTDWQVSYPDGFGLNYLNEYGLGFTHGYRDGFQIIGHNGSVAGSGAIMQYIPEFDVYIVATRNTDENNHDDDRSFPDLVERVKRALKGESQEYTPPAPPT